MPIRIVDNFWDNYKNNIDVIIRCFRYHFKRYPDPEGKAPSLNNLLVKMYEMRVFERFDLMKLVEAADKAGIISKNELTGFSEEDLIEAGINVNKKWEQFLFKWIEKIINREYNIRGKIPKTFCHGDYFADYGVPKENACPWISTAKEAETYEKKYTSYKPNDRRGRKVPPSFTNRYIAGEEGFDNPYEAYSADDLRSSINSRLSGIEGDVLALLEQGYSEREIADKLGFSQQHINTKIRKIRSITSNFCLV